MASLTNVGLVVSDVYDARRRRPEKDWPRAQWPKRQAATTEHRLAAKKALERPSTLSRLAHVTSILMIALVAPCFTHILDHFDALSSLTQCCSYHYSPHQHRQRSRRRLFLLCILVASSNPLLIQDFGLRSELLTRSHPLLLQTGGQCPGRLETHGMFRLYPPVKDLLAIRKRYVNVPIPD